MDVHNAWERLTVDPLGQRLRRALQVGFGVGIIPELWGPHLPQLALGSLRLGLRTRSIYALHAIHHPDRLALVDERRALSYAQVNQEINRLSSALLERFGVQRRTKVLLMLANSTEYVVAWFALARRGASAVHASYRLTAKELEYLVRHSGAAVVLTDDLTVETARAVQKDFPELKLRIVVATERGSAPEGCVTYRDVVAAGSPEWKPARKELGNAENVVYTSGTTGKPKGAVRDFSAYSLGELFRVLERLPFKMGDQHLVVSPLYHSAGQVFVLLQAALAATVHLRPHFEPEDTLAALSQLGIQSTFMVPTMIRKLVQLPDAAFAQNPTPQLRALVSGASEFPQRLREQAMARFGAPAIFDFYGATELGWVTLISGPEMQRKPLSVGRPLAGQEVRIRDDQGRDLPVGQVGQIYVRNAQTMAGYLNDAASTAASRSGEWMTVEDLGYLDAEGYLFLSGRARDMVKSGGVNIYPVEIEEVLGRHPSVQDVAVVGVPDPEWGEKLVGVVVPSGGGFDPAELERFARQHLSGPKIPRRWEVMEELPRNANGKVLKVELRQRYAPVQAAP